MTTIRNMMAVSVAAMLGLAGSVSAQSFPDKPITMIVPFAAGTSTDTVSRLIAERMSEDLGQTVVVENRAGAGGSVGTQDVVSSDADGYTIAMGTVGTLAINKSIFPELPYDPESDVTPIAFVGYTPTLLVVSAESSFQTLNDLVEAARSEDGVTFASTGNGTSTHLAGELLKTLSDTNMIHVPFGSGAVGLAAVMSGEVDFMFNHPVSAKQNVDAGKLRALGVSGAAGSEVAPEVPPINDSYEGFDLIAWWLMHGPADMPADVTEKLNMAVTNALASDAVSEHFVKSGISKGEIPFAELEGFISSEVNKWGDIANAANAQAN
ncbi:Tripartite-type tricarboxylate transporter, receptor component TctC [Roseovarius litoreus]|uniref:Tripartite-type tricarboxylate transporter, receptor component TctC n=1 Tax=Roseovarius litoreus TaxID=1155722 RepID=A0A1M7JCV7_9RHOB|nr:tripartite tricarboxylate transporter substrate-binding protein [Roseovarius litoreus]SHM50930.1 Tripartite-type tricarboxylate transporter, receptor component TctC [Roseovarius litoreus]